MGVETNINPNRHKDRVIAITGGNNGIGEEVSIRFAQEGAATVFILSRSPADRVIERMKPFGTTGIWVPCDVADEDSTVKAAKEIESSGQKLNTLVNNAGITEEKVATRAGFIDSTRREDVQRIMEVNFTGAYMVTKHLLKRDLFVHDEPGSINFMDDPILVPSVVNMASDLGRYWNMQQEKYDATKAALIAFTRSLTATVYSEYGYFLRANAVCPAFITTEMTGRIPSNLAKLMAYATPLRRLGKPEEVAAVVAHLASDEARFVTGIEYSVNGGLAGGISAPFMLHEAGIKVEVEK